MTIQHSEVYFVPGQIVHGVDEVTQVAAEAIEFSDRECITLTQCLEAGVEPRTAVAFTGGVIFIEAIGLDTSGDVVVRRHDKPIRERHEEPIPELSTRDRRAEAADENTGRSGGNPAAA